MKRCSVCRNELPEDAFDPSKKSSDGLAFWCRGCRAAYHRSYKKRVREQTGKSRLSWEEALWNGAKKRAKARGMPFDISPSDISIPERCPVLGIRIIRGGPSRSNSATLDRVVNDKGYVKGNVAVISGRANTLKSNMTLEEVERIASYMRKNIARLSG